MTVFLIASQQIENLEVSLDAERQRRNISKRGIAREAGVSYHVVHRTLEGDLPTAQHASHLLIWLHNSTTKKESG